MEARAHANPYPDFSACSTFIKDGCVTKTLTDCIDSIINQIVKELSVVLESSNPKGENSIYTGYSGIAMFLLMVAIKRNDKKLMLMVEKKCQMAVDNLSESVRKKKISFLNGDAGPITLCVIIRKLFDDDRGANHFAQRLVDLGKIALTDKSLPNEILYGRAGYLFALLLANKYLGDDDVNPGVIRNIAQSIIEQGRLLSRCKDACVPLEFEWHDKNYLGAAHGVSGILYILLLSHNVLSNYERDELIKPTIEWMLKKYRFRGGNFASSAGSDRDRLVQWCHGAPGFVHLLLLAAEVYKDEKYKQAAIECGEVIWDRGLLTKGYSLCHGVSGNAYAFLQLYKVTKDLKYYHRAACFADWCTKYPRNQGLNPDRPYSLYEGVAGMAYFLLDFLQPFESSFPGFDL